MKRLLTLITFTLAAGITLAQKAPTMELFATGFTGPDSIKNYVVIEVPGVKKADLFKKTMVYLNGLYTNPQSAIKSVDGESIIVDANTNAIKGPYSFADYLTYYHIEMEFKDGKIRFQPTIAKYQEFISKTSEPHNYYVSNLFSPDPSYQIDCVWVVNKPGSKPHLFKDEFKAPSELWVNNYIKGIVAKINDKW